MKAIRIGIFAIFVSAIANAEPVETAYFAIDKVRVSDHSGNAYIDPVGAAEVKNPSCSSTSLYAFNKSDELFNQLYSTALTAAASGKEIKVWISNDVDDCVTGFQRIRLIEIDW